MADVILTPENWEKLESTGLSIEKRCDITLIPDDERTPEQNEGENAKWRFYKAGEKRVLVDGVEYNQEELNYLLSVTLPLPSKTAVEI